MRALQTIFQKLKLFPGNKNPFSILFPQELQLLFQGLAHSHTDSNTPMRLAEWCPGLVPRLPDIPGNLSNSVLGQPGKVGDRCCARGIGNGWRHCLSFAIFLLCCLSSIVFLLLKCPSNLCPCSQLSAQQKQTGVVAAPASGDILMSNRVVSQVAPPASKSLSTGRKSTNTETFSWEILPHPKGQTALKNSSLQT